MKTDTALDAMQNASKGLLMPSEGEAPFEPFLWNDAGDKLTQDRLLTLAGSAKGVFVEEMSLDSLFQTVPSEDKAKFQKLAAAIQQQLSGVKVYKVGKEAERNVYIVGKTKDGHWAGLKTRVVET